MTLTIQGTYRHRARTKLPKWLQRIFRVEEFSGPWQEDPFEKRIPIPQKNFTVSAGPLEVVVKASDPSIIVVSLRYGAFTIWDQPFSPEPLSTSTKFHAEPSKGVIVEGAVSLL
jgi:hypothetical protein